MAASARLRSRARNCGSGPPITPPSASRDLKRSCRNISRSMRQPTPIPASAVFRLGLPRLALALASSCSPYRRSGTRASAMPAAGRGRRAGAPPPLAPPAAPPPMACFMSSSSSDMPDCWLPAPAGRCASASAGSGMASRRFSTTRMQLSARASSRVSRPSLSLSHTAKTLSTTSRTADASSPPDRPRVRPSGASLLRWRAAKASASARVSAPSPSVSPSPKVTFAMPSSSCASRPS
mmetsp:Transcript_31393/g.101493  ORF Transcript_31393/g.101493 Transcript_31393/m.101493 type:complete len:237 (+) Transcript_31393:1350-2060(+)|eukprot:scaffold8767_cov121-Isochrysis_galbana.AAC.3